jgi:hypothetical protein
MRVCPARNLFVGRLGHLDHRARTPRGVCGQPQVQSAKQGQRRSTYRGAMKTEKWGDQIDERRRRVPRGVVREDAENEWFHARSLVPKRTLPLP